LPLSIPECCAQTYHDIHQFPSPNKQEKFQEGFSVITDVHNVARLMDCTKILIVAMVRFEMHWKRKRL